MKWMPVFDPGFEPYCNEYAKSVVAYRDDTYLLGYFSDNELAAPEDLLDVYPALDSNDRGTAAGRAVRFAGLCFYAIDRLAAAVLPRGAGGGLPPGLLPGR
jgi:hypothetical protein